MASVEAIGDPVGVVRIEGIDEIQRYRRTERSRIELMRGAQIDAHMTRNMLVVSGAGAQAAAVLEQRGELREVAPVRRSGVRRPALHVVEDLPAVVRKVVWREEISRRLDAAPERSLQAGIGKPAQVPQHQYRAGLDSDGAPVSEVVRAHQVGVPDSDIVELVAGKPAPACQLEE